MTDENKDNIKVAFNEWLTQSKDNKIKTTSLTASEYIHIFRSYYVLIYK